MLRFSSSVLTDQETRASGKVLRGIAVPAGVGAAHIGIHRIVAHRQIGFCKDAFGFYLSNDRFHHIITHRFVYFHLP